MGEKENCLKGRLGTSNETELIIFRSISIPIPLFCIFCGDLVSNLIGEVRKGKKQNDLRQGFHPINHSLNGSYDLVRLGQSFNHLDAFSTSVDNELRLLQEIIQNIRSVKFGQQLSL